MAAPSTFFIVPCTCIVTNPSSINEQREPADLDERKSALRKIVLRRRSLASNDKGPAAASLAAERFLETMPIEPGQVVGGYWAINDEMDDVILLSKLQRIGVSVALPSIVRGSNELTFRRWDMAKVPPVAGGKGASAIPAPGPDCPVVEPDILVVPLVAFDRQGWRLGLGGGYYDRLLGRLRLARTVTAVGFAFAVQEVPHVPHGKFDQKIDWIVTEREMEKLS